MWTLDNLYQTITRIVLADARFFQSEDGVDQMIEQGIDEIEKALAQAMNVEQTALAGIPKDTEIPEAVILVVKSFFARLKKKDGQIFGYLPA